jgi:hypothetical protein
MATKPRAKFSDEEKAAYLQAQREQAQQQFENAVAALQSEEGFAAWLDARARFHTYSFANTLLIWAQCPEATRVAAASVWRELGRYPAKGSHALRVYAPITWYIPCDEGDPGARWNEKKRRWERKIAKFKLVPVFDVSQTDGDELPAPPPAVEPEGDSHAHLEPKLLKLADELGYTVTTEQTDPGVGGYCDSQLKRIVIGLDHTPNARVRVLVHELAHAQGVSYKDYGREAAETIVEAATFIVLAGQGFDVTTASVPYVAGWSGQDGIEKLQRFAEVIDEVARKIEQAL